MNLNKFIPLTKMEEAADGSLFVFGTVTAEQPDLEKEVCDYATTKPLYEKRTQERFTLTSKISGMTPSLMAMRGQHDPHQAIGAGRSLVFDDAAKTIKMGFQIVDSDAVKKWKSGVFVGFSQGGDYVKRWEDPTFPGCVRYTADPSEVSSVDSPCLPSALVETMKGRTVTLTKSTGVTEEVPFMIQQVDSARIDALEKSISTLIELVKEKKTKRVAGVDLPASSFAYVGDPEKTETWKLPIIFPGDEEKTKSHIRNALARFEQTEGMSADDKAKAKRKILAAARARGIEASESEKVAIVNACAKMAFVNGLDSAEITAKIEAMEWDALVKGADDSAAQSGQGEASVNITNQDELTKAAKTIHEHLDAHHEMHKAHHELHKAHHEKLKEHLAAGHPLIAHHEKAMAHHDKMVEHIQKCMKACGDAMDGKEPEKVAPVADTAEKTLAAKIDGLEKALAGLTEQLSKSADLSKAPHTGAGAVQKSVEVPQEFAAFGDLLK